jgi:hypothetical protein
MLLLTAPAIWLQWSWRRWRACPGRRSCTCTASTGRRRTGRATTPRQRRAPSRGSPQRASWQSTPRPAQVALLGAPAIIHSSLSQWPNLGTVYLANKSSRPNPFEWESGCTSWAKLYSTPVWTCGMYDVVSHRVCRAAGVRARDGRQLPGGAAQLLGGAHRLPAERRARHRRPARARWAGACAA